MAENKTKPTDVSVADTIAAIPDAAKRDDAKTLVKIMRAVTGKPPKMWGPSIIGLGLYHYTHDSGREGDMPWIGFSPRKAALVLYMQTGFADLQAHLPKLGKHSTGGVCLYVKRLEDVDLKVLETMIAKSVKAVRVKYKV